MQDGLVRQRKKQRREPEREVEPPEDLVGGQIRELRKTKRLTLQEVADAVGVSVGYLSQIERNQSKLPIGVLRKISDLFGVHINWFFPPADGNSPEERDVVVRAKSRRKMSFTGLGITEELLSPNLAGPLELLLSTLQPGADSGDYSHGGSEAGYVIQGLLDLWVDGRLYQLRQGDSFAFESARVHRVSNPGRLPTRVIWVITPPYY
ncbi:MAG: XRE family transcriptional regulator [Hyphomicrobiaceae bacterium]|nr:XRE family transcriptional regulator [Hyphomicrobiaceae bacterium]